MIRLNAGAGVRPGTGPALMSKDSKQEAEEKGANSCHLRAQEYRAGRR
jgi:hypothetical protein